ncbi:fructose-bisphosphate aldolase [Vulcanimicrobium alpinum]|uniref:Probable fructose-bisphosphate aldolase class 1 n=1 Tax=Vulcanimicrobium alpinum TaxID=3016050 RepID=A0AAN1XZ84_UNVUL|nr:class I fructose-bisphosphate aldolase [Vulcanimicrobium alpinum]BDE08103.1 fructose-bisphosphate aldolase [Vulcanimicrobium alpinum]
MQSAGLPETARALVRAGRGILAIDESVGTCNARFAKLEIDESVEARRAYRELLIAAPGIEASVSGMILYDETIRQHTAAGVPFVDALRSRGMHAGIKVDTGTKRLPFTDAETITEGLDGLRDRLDAYRAMGATFAKWRAVFRITAGTPSPRAIRTNAHALARYAALCQECGIVPIVEPEVLGEGDHDLATSEDVTRRILAAVFDELALQGVVFEAMILKPNMVLPGSSARPISLDEIVAANLRVLRDTVPAAVPGIAFLSGGQDDRAATERLNAFNALGGEPRPWVLTFSFGRAIQQPALERWRGRPENVAAAQEILVRRALCNARAAEGRYDASFEQSLSAVS